MSLTRRELKKHRVDVVKTTNDYSEPTLLVDIASVGRYWRFSAACTITVPDDRTIVVDSEIRGRQGSAGEITFIPIDGVVINGVDGYNNAINLEGSVFRLKKVAEMEWDLEGIPSLAVAASPDVTPPTITSSATVSVFENNVLTHALTADEPVVWSIVGSADMAQFDITAATLRWLSGGTRDFEAPADANVDNAYLVTVRATDLAANTTDQIITVTVLDEIEAGAGTLTLTGSAPALVFGVLPGAGTLVLIGGAGLVNGHPTFTTANKNPNITLTTPSEADWTSGSGRRNVYSTRNFGDALVEKLVFAVQIDAVSTATDIGIGVPSPTFTNTSSFNTTGVDYTRYDIIGGTIAHNANAVSIPVATAGVGDIVMVAVHATGSTYRVYFGKNGTWLNGDPGVGTGYVEGTVSAVRCIGATTTATGVGVTLVPYPYAVPAGFRAPGDS